MTAGTKIATFFFFAGLIWVVAWLTFQITRAYMEQAIAEQQRMERAKKEKKKRQKLKDLEDVTPKKRTVRFEPAEEEPEPEPESDIEEPSGKYVYDPKAHKVVFVPAE